MIGITLLEKSCVQRLSPSILLASCSEMKLCDSEEYCEAGNQMNMMQYKSELLLQSVIDSIQFEPGRLGGEEIFYTW